jgi:Tesmin/TSO1-like CXC domain, cysteine-rich domain
MDNVDNLHPSPKLIVAENIVGHHGIMSSSSLQPSSQNHDDAVIGCSVTSGQGTTPTPRYSEESNIIENKENTLLNDETITVGNSSSVPVQYNSGQVNRDGSNSFAPNSMYYPPTMAYTNSLTFSDISMPFPSLVTSKSFGPNGVLNYQQNNLPVVPTTQLQNYTSFGLLHGTDSTSLSPFLTPCITGESKLPQYPMQTGQDLNFNNSQLASSNELNIVANALLDLTPALVQQDPSPNPSLLSNNSDHLINQACHIVNNQSQPPKKLISARPKKIARDSNSIENEAKFPFLMMKARLESRVQELLTDIPYTLQACKCKNTHCLKLYCNCFQTGTFCDELVCQCRGCENSAEHSKPRGARTRAIYEILHRRLDAFEPRQRKKTGYGCSCKKSKYVNI